MLVGITGPSGSGKSIVVSAFAERGFVNIDADRVAREIVMPGQTALMELADRFGGDIINSDGTLNRHLLGSRAFSSPENTDMLNSIMLDSIRRCMLERADECRRQGVNCVFDAPLLFEANLGAVCDCIIAVTAPVELRVSRLAIRDGLDETEIRKRMARQHEDEYYTERADLVLVNDDNEDAAALAAKTIVDKVINGNFGQSKE